jgi:hypothetical protein
MRFAALAFIAGLTLLIALADLGRLPGPVLFLYTLPLGDKLAHLTLGALGAFLVDAALPQARSRRLPLGSSLLALALGLEEASQGLNSLRVCDPLDLAATLVGVGLGAALQSLWSSRQA